MCLREMGKKVLLHVIYLLLSVTRCWWIQSLSTRATLCNIFFCCWNVRAQNTRIHSAWMWVCGFKYRILWNSRLDLHDLYKLHDGSTALHCIRARGGGGGVEQSLSRAARRMTSALFFCTLYVRARARPCWSFHYSRYSIYCSTLDSYLPFF